MDHHFPSTIALLAAGSLSAGIAAAEPFIYVIDDPLERVYVIDGATDTWVDTIPLPPPEPGGYPDQGSPQADPGPAVVSRNGRHLIVAQEQRRDIYIIDTDTGNVRWRRAHTATDISLSRDGSTAFLSSKNGFVSVVRKGAPVRRFRVYESEVPIGTWTLGSPDGRLAYTMAVAFDLAPFLQVTDLVTLAEVATIPACGGDMAITPDGRFLYSACAGAVDVLDLQTYAVVETVMGFDLADEIEIHPSGTEAYVLDRGLLEVVVLSLPDNDVVGRIPVFGDRPRHMTMTRDGAKLYVSHWVAGAVEAISTGARESLRVIQTDGYPSYLASGPSGSPF
jgi:DNA-binding beta-propeller fold protein YncE